MHEEYQPIKAAIARRVNELMATKGIEPAEADKLLDAAVAVYCVQRACTFEEMLEYINEWTPASCQD